MFRYCLFCILGLAIGFGNMEDDGSVDDYQHGEDDLSIFQTNPLLLKMKRFSALNTMKAKSRLRFQYILDKIRFSHVG